MCPLRSLSQSAEYSAVATCESQVVRATAAVALRLVKLARQQILAHRKAIRMCVLSKKILTRSKPIPIRNHSCETWSKDPAISHIVKSTWQSNVFGSYGWKEDVWRLRFSHT